MYLSKSLILSTLIALVVHPFFEYPILFGAVSKPIAEQYTKHSHCLCRIILTPCYLMCSSFEYNNWQETCSVNTDSDEDGYVFTISIALLVLRGLLPPPYDSLALSICCISANFILSIYVAGLCFILQPNGMNQIKPCLDGMFINCTTSFRLQRASPRCLQALRVLCDETLRPLLPHAA